MTTLKNDFINEIIRIEGGYVNDPNDSGGETKYGITKSVARANGWKTSMKEFPHELAVRIYEDRYWNKMSMDAVEDISPMIAEEMLDTGVNMGTDRAGEFLQRSLNCLNNQGQHYPDIVVDRQIGPASIGALKAYHQRRGEEGMKILNNMMNCLQGAFYVTLSERREKDEKFIYGWFKNRIKIS